MHAFTFRDFFALAAVLLVGGAGCTTPRGGVQHSTVTYHGWPGAIHLSNGRAEVFIVPAVGRVMQFGFVGEPGVFWENRALDGRALDPSADWKAGEWVNFGGDKSWPSPESDWPKLTQRTGWRPPPAFDSLPVAARFDGRDVVLTSPVDPFFGIRTIRRVQLDDRAPVLRIITTYERVTGAPIKVGIWVITQLKEPAGVFVPADTLANLGKDLPPNLKSERGLISLVRNPKAAHKIGTTAGALLWVGEQAMCRIDSPRVPGAEYPDRNSSAEVYTNPDPLPYIELETLGPLHVMKPGDTISATNTYTLMRRAGGGLETEARRALGR